MDKVDEEIGTISTRLDTDLRAAILMYITERKTTDQLVAQAFADGASWMMERMPQFFDAVKGAVERHPRVEP